MRQPPRATRSPNQVLTHAARAAASQLNKLFFSHSVAAREGPGFGQSKCMAELIKVYGFE